MDTEATYLMQAPTEEVRLSCMQPTKVPFYTRDEDEDEDEDEDDDLLDIFLFAQPHDFHYCCDTTIGGRNSYL